MYSLVGIDYFVAVHYRTVCNVVYWIQILPEESLQEIPGVEKRNAQIMKRLQEIAAEKDPPWKPKQEQRHDSKSR